MTPHQRASVLAEAERLLKDISNDGNWQAWRSGNQGINISSQSPFKGTLVGASEVKGLPRAWNPHFVGINVFSLPEEFNVTRLRDEDADFIAAAPRLVRDLRSLITSQEARIAEIVAEMRGATKVFQVAPGGGVHAEAVSGHSTLKWADQLSALLSTPSPAPTAQEQEQPKEEDVRMDSTSELRQHIDAGKD